jgi:hypothetical protein
MTVDLRHALVVASHAINRTPGLGEYRFVDSVMTSLAIKAMRVVCVISGHDSFVEDGLMTDITIVRTVGADWRAI